MRFSDVCFLSPEQVDRLHDFTIAAEDQGGSPGVRDRGLIDSAVMAPQGGYYSSLAEMAAVYGHGLAKNHGYIDGNKRVALLAIAAFLHGNNCEAEELGPEWPAMLVAVADGSMSRDQLTREITRLMGGDPVAIED